MSWIKYHSELCTNYRTVLFVGKGLFFFFKWEFYLLSESIVEFDFFHIPFSTSFIERKQKKEKFSLILYSMNNSNARLNISWQKTFLILKKLIDFYQKIWSIRDIDWDEIWKRGNKIEFVPFFKHLFVIFINCVLNFI